MQETKILIVGGGPAGATVAKYLSKASIENILIQRNFGFKKPCGGGIRLDGFDEFEVDKTIIKKHVDTIALVYKSKRVEINISETPLGIVDRVEFDTLLREDAQKAGTEILEAAFVSLEMFDKHVISTIKKGDEYINIRSEYVIAADGVNSKIRKQVNGESVNSNLSIYTDITSKEYSACEFHFGSKVADRYYAWAFPHAEGSNIGTLADGSKECLENMLQSIEVDEKTKALGYGIPNFKDNVFYNKRVFYVGDSASQVLPFTYEGIYYAMSSAKILADVIIENKDGREYEKRWNKKHLKKFQTLYRLQQIFLRNDFMISIMMRLYESGHIQRQMIKFWLGKRDLEINFAFFMRVLKRVLIKRA